MRDSTLSIYTTFRADFSFEVVNSVTCGGQVVLCIKDFLKTVCNEGHHLYKFRQNIWGEEVRKKEKKGSKLENMFTEVFPCIRASLFFGSAASSLPT